MAEEAVQTPQGEVGASDGGSQENPVTEGSNPSMLGSTPVAEETGEQGQGEQPGAQEDGEKKAKGDGEDGKAKEGEEEEKAEGAPESYTDFSLPEGMQIDAAAMEKAAPLFKELNLSQENAQRLVDQYAELVQQQGAKQREATDKLREGWRQEFTSDPNHKQTLGNAKKAVEAFGDDTLKEMLYGNWVGDHPAMLNFLGRVGAAMNNDKFIEGGAAGSDGSRLDRIYDKMG